MDKEIIERVREDTYKLIAASDVVADVYFCERLEVLVRQILSHPNIAIVKYCPKCNQIAKAGAGMCVECGYIWE